MTAKPDPKLAGLLQIATVLADRACQDLARATRDCAALEVRLDTLSQMTAQAVSVAPDLAEEAIVAKWQRARNDRRADLLQHLAIAQAKRLEKQAYARQAEGRRQALESLVTQAS
ncbi:hypothetical protein E2K80_16960 [Rhodophyticola sp. CCM32]|uniref:hypothetical protein n=1 Tax=Rhodophyticola sp. CCM32 TaxID=2916397 RepID=UPI00107FAFA5|nr:hypothetical protein [Rhodophyticola sp. CCM32]QBY02221.1 hypothetical protein E2K80_16960 [Rhodophyticola sp. CCM32]